MIVAVAMRSSRERLFQGNQDPRFLTKKYTVGLLGCGHTGPVQLTLDPVLMTLKKSWGSVADPRHFGVDPDPRIHASALTNGSGFRRGSESFYFHI
jgi:hypothetical protein